MYNLVKHSTALKKPPFGGFFLGLTVISRYHPVDSGSGEASTGAQYEHPVDMSCELFVR